MILLRRSTMLAKTKEKDVIDQLLDQIDFHGMTAEELAGENGLSPIEFRAQYAA